MMKTTYNERNLTVTVGNMRLIPSRFDSACNVCGTEIRKGDEIQHHVYTGAVCLSCDGNAYYKKRCAAMTKIFEAKKKEQEAAYIDKAAEVYTYGSFKDGTYIWAYEIRYLGKTCMASGKGSDEKAAAMRNIAGELSAVMRALSAAKKMGITHVELHHCHEGIGPWLQGSWKANKDKVKAFIVFVNSLGLNVDYVWRKGYSGESGSERIIKP
jgi:ribonuclease HI